MNLEHAFAVYVFDRAASDFVPLAVFSKAEDAEDYRARNPVADGQKTVVAEQTMDEIFDHIVSARLARLGVKLDLVQVA